MGRLPDGAHTVRTPPPGPALRHHLLSVRTSKNRSPPTVKARSRLIGTTGKQPDQASAQPGYWPELLLTACVFVQDCLSARAKSVAAHLIFCSWAVDLELCPRCQQAIGQNLYHLILENPVKIWTQIRSKSGPPQSGLLSSFIGVKPMGWRFGVPEWT